MCHLCNANLFGGNCRHDRNTKRRKLRNGLGCGSGLGDGRVQVRSHRSGVLVTLMMLVMASLALGACSDMDGSAGWFSRRFDIAGRSAGYSFSELSETKNREKPITPNDLVNANGSCPAPAAAAPPAPPPPATAAATPPGAPGSDRKSVV